MKEYTRVASKVNNEGRTIITKSLIDHFATNRKRHILKSEAIQTSMVDHYLIIGTRKINAWRILQKCQKTIETRMLKNYNKDEFLSALQSVAFKTLFSGLWIDPNLMTETFHEIFELMLRQRVHGIGSRTFQGRCWIKNIFRNKDFSNSFFWKQRWKLFEFHRWRRPLFVLVLKQRVALSFPSRSVWVTNALL